MPKGASTSTSARRGAGRFVIVSLGLLGIAGLVTPQPLRPGTLIWNYTPSIPIGLYRIDSRPWRKDDRVAVKPSTYLEAALVEAQVLEPGRLLLKRVVAIGGDEVCRQADRVSVNGVEVAVARSTDTAGQPLPSWRGCRRLDASEVFLLGEIPASFDGRYFGAISADQIVGPLRLLFQLPR